jgi:demethylmenaquinone methyltransferase / 2-methoxy-6-polyprenyl-1,4-benzoquinol methylase
LPLKYTGMTVVPYKNEALGKKQQVAKMFNSISKRYDFLNHFLSLGIDIRWRRKAIRFLQPFKPKTILDVATGTGDFAFEALALSPEKVIGVDISEGMLDVGRKKVLHAKMNGVIELLSGDSENLQFADGFFDAVTVAFGVRNFENLDKGLSEIYRVTKAGGHVVVLEFSRPTGFPWKQLYNAYFKVMLPMIGRLVSRDKAAYTYLPESVDAFPDGDNFLKHLEKAGFTHTKAQPLTFGISSLYTATK